MIVGLKAITISDLNNEKESFTFKAISKEFTLVRRGVMFWAGMVLLVPIVLLVSLFLVAKLLS